MKFFANILVFYTIIAFANSYKIPQYSENDSLDSSSLECTACKVLVSLIDKLVLEHKSIDEIKKLAIDVCQDLHIEINRVCVGLVNTYAPDVASLLRDAFVSPDTICGALFGSSCATTTMPRFWNVTLPNDDPSPPYKPLSMPPKGKPTFKVLHLADLHIDPSYTVGTEAECGAIQCCDYTMAGPNSMKTKPFATLSNCDIPKSTVVTLLKDIAKQDFDWIYWTGDITPHNIGNQTKEMHINLINQVTSLMKTYLPNAKIYPAIGNHEIFPVSQFPYPYTDANKSAAPSEWLYSLLAENWKSWINDSDAESTILKAAYYSKKIAPKLRLISYNGGIGDNQNFYAYTNVVDPYDQLKWLAQQLQDAQDAGDFVHIIGHEPPYGSTTKVYWKNYYKIIRKYANIVRGQFAAHTHKDEFRVFYEDAVNGNCGTPYGVMYVAPSLTTYTRLNPAFRIYEIDGDWDNSTWSVLDFKAYSLNLTKAEANHETPQFEYLYSPLEDYSMSSLFPQSWSELIKRFETDHALYHKYYHHFFRRNSFNPTNTTQKVDFLEKLSSGNYGQCNL